MDEIELGYDEPMCAHCGRDGAGGLEWATRPKRPDAATAKRRWTATGPRDRRLQVRYSEDEMDELREVADRVGTTPGAWVAQIALAYARGQLRPVPADWQDVLAQLIRERVSVTRAFTLLNQLTRHANATGELEAETAAGLATAHTILTRLDELTAEASQRLSRAR